MTEKMDIRKPRLPSDVGWHDIEISDNKTQNLVWWNERNGRDLCAKHDPTDYKAKWMAAQLGGGGSVNL
ncbi:MAG TPA: hypothetical protein VIX91_26605 [Candidatus Acidoferrum sp.]